MRNISATYRKFLFLLVKFSIVIASFYFIYIHTIHNNTINFKDFIFQIEKIVTTNYSVVFYLLLFTFFNWFFEILKWQNLVSVLQKISFIQALKQSLGSHTASLFTPNRIGEYGAKLLYFKKSNSKKIVLLNLLSNISQMSVTVLFGIFGLLYLWLYFNWNFPIFRPWKFIYLIVFILIFFFGGKKIISKKIRGFYWNKIIQFIKTIPVKVSVLTLVYSIIRYLIFSHQFYFLLRLFHVEVDYQTIILLIFAMYLIASIIPSLPMFDFLIKGSVAVFVFGFISINELIVVTITTVMWLLNFAFPAIIGSYFVLNFKFMEGK